MLIPIVPFVLLGWYLEPQIESWLSHESFQDNLGIFFAAVVFVLGIDIALPVPSSFVGTLSGQVLGITGGTLATWMGLNVSCWVGYAAARRWGHTIVKRFTSESYLDDVRRIGDSWGIWVLLIVRGVPVLAETSVILAGLSHMPLPKFWPVILASNLGLAIAYAALGQWSASQGWAGLALGISLGIPVALLAMWWLAKKQHKVDQAKLK